MAYYFCQHHGCYNAIVPSQIYYFNSMCHYQPACRVDASLKAYGAAAFLKQDEQPATLVISKSRATPLKQVMLPKLELMAAVLSARLSEFVMASLNINCTLYL